MLREEPERLVEALGDADEIEKPTPSSTRMAWPSKVSQYVIFRSLPVVRSWDSSGWYRMLLKKVEAWSEAALL